jgi:hypothetical protein
MVLQKRWTGTSITKHEKTEMVKASDFKGKHSINEPPVILSASVALIFIHCNYWSTTANIKRSTYHHAWRNWAL